MVADNRLSLPLDARLVFLSAGGTWADPEIRRLLTTPLRWPAVLALSQREGATPIVLARIRELGGPDLPTEPLTALQRLAEVQEFRMALLDERLSTFLGALEELRIPAILLKGAAIAWTKAGAFHQRPMGDLDVLVPEAEAGRVHELALTMGWTTPGRGLTPEMYQDLHHLQPLDASDGLGFGLEIHTELFPDWSPLRFSAGDVWRDAERIVRPGSFGAALVPSLHHQLLHTCLHFAWSHCFGRGAWRMVRDVDLLLADPRLDPATVVRDAKEARAGTCVYWTLALMRALTGRPLPDGLLEGLDVSPPELLRVPLLRHLAEEAQGNRGTPGTRRLRRTLWTMAIRPRRSGHGRVRPWTGAERWATVADPFGLDQDAGNRLSLRLRGFFGYSARVLLGRGA
jgi:hypothetical protein